MYVESVCLSCPESPEISLKIRSATYWQKYMRAYWQNFSSVASTILQLWGKGAYWAISSFPQLWSSRWEHKSAARQEEVREHSMELSRISWNLCYIMGAWGLKVRTLSWLTSVMIDGTWEAFYWGFSSLNSFFACVSSKFWAIPDSASASASASLPVKTFLPDSSA